jgi:AraC-like DNA-binding protein
MLSTRRPSERLRGFVSHYWLSLDNAQSAQAVLPDGEVDVVLKVLGNAVDVSVYGTTTRPVEVALERGAHYLGVRFKPGQCRHFLTASAHELTDAREAAEGLLLPDVEGLGSVVSSDRVFACLDETFERHIACSHPAPSRIDQVIALIAGCHGDTRLEEAAKCFGQSRRHLERVFLTTVGVKPKFFAQVARFRRASALVHRAGAPLADIAAACGYADQSHMTREFARFAGMTPLAYARADVAFFQDTGGAATAR